MNKKTQKIKYSEVDIGNAHFTLSYKSDDDENCYHVAIMSTGVTIDDIKIQLLDDLLPKEVIESLENTVEYFLYRLNPSASPNKKLGYLTYYCTTISNCYGPIVWGFVDGITSSNILYYIKTQGKLTGAYHRSLVRDLQDCYVQLITFILFDQALHEDDSNRIAHYNTYLNRIYTLLFDKLPNKMNFLLKERCNIVEFANWLSCIEVTEYCHILNYLDYLQLVRKKDITELLKLFYHNKKLQQDL